MPKWSNFDTIGNHHCVIMGFEEKIEYILIDAKSKILVNK
jgi:hypothetical protein